MPLTLQFGPWAPDQAQNPLQFYDQPGPLSVPCADCLNVLYANGNYRSIASPSTATIDGNAIQPLSVAPVSAFSYFDTVEQQETVFVGMAGGVQQLNADGTWSQISLITSQAVALPSLSLAVTLGNFANALTLRSQIVRMAIGVLTPLISGVSFVAGQHAIPRPGVTLTGLSTLATTFGALVTQDLSFGLVQQVYDGSSGSCLFSVSSATNPLQSAFATITANGKTFTSASATYSYSASLGVATWNWVGAFGFAQGSTYQVVIA